MAGAVALAMAACGPTPATPSPVAPVARASDAETLAHWPRFTSTRFGVTLPLPDGKSWKVDDHSRPELMATRAATGEAVVIRAWSSEELQSRQRCEVTARLWGLFPDAQMEPVEDGRVTAPGTFDTRLVVAVEAGENRALRGHVVAVGGWIRRCIFFHYTIDVAPQQHDLLSARLALARTRIFGELGLGNLSLVPRVPREQGPPQ